MRLGWTSRCRGSVRRPKLWSVAANGVLIPREPLGWGVAQDAVDLACVGHERDLARENALLGGGLEECRVGRQAADRVSAGAARLDALLREELARRLFRRRPRGEGERDDGVLRLAHPHHGLLLVLRLEATRECQLEAEVRVVEGIFPEETLPRVVAEDHSVELLEVLAAMNERARGPGAGDLPLDPCRPVLGAGVGGEPVGHPAAAAFRARHTVEDAEDLEHLPGIVVLAEHVAQAELVGLVFVVAAELHEQQAQGLLGQAAELLQFGLHGHAHDQAAHGELLLAHLARRVAAGHVADLVPEDCHQLGLGAQVRHDAASDVDVPAGQGEGVDGGVVDDLEAPGQVGPLGPGGEALAEPLDVGLDPRVRVEAVRGCGFLVGRLAHRDFLGLAHQHQLLLAGGGIGGARDDGRDSGGRRQLRAAYGLARR